MLYKTDWKGNTADETGIATFNYGSNRISFKMSSFGDYLALCHIIRKSCEETEQNTKTDFLRKINLVIEGKM